MKKFSDETLKTLVNKGFSPMGGGGCKPIKSVLSACMLATSLSLCTPALADQIFTPTLDKLHQSGTTMPESTEIYPESAYKLTETDAPGENTITLYEQTAITKYFDPKTGAEVAYDALLPDVEYKEVKTTEITPKYYTVSLKQTEYGSGDGVKYFKWDKTDELKLVETTNPAEAEITAKYDTTQLHNRLENRKDNSATNIEGGSFVGCGNSIQGGAIYNQLSYAKLGDINADFVGNYLLGSSSSSAAMGGAIFNNKGEIGDITGDFIGNYVSVLSSASVNAEGGAIYNSGGAKFNKVGGIIGNITGDFIGNYASGQNYAYGGAIYNVDGGEIGDITGDFIGNYVSSSSSSSYYSDGGAIYNTGTIGDITGDFIGNYVSSSYSSSRGGAIYNNGTIGDITGDFIGNYVSSSSYSDGGAIYNTGTIGDITGDFIGNYVSSSSYSDGGAIYNEGTIGDITGNFIGNYSSSSTGSIGGAIFNAGKIGNISGDFIGNYSSSSSSSSTGSMGGAIMNMVTIGEITGSFINNKAESTSGIALGGAILSMSPITLSANNSHSLISGNRTISNGKTEQNAIAMYGFYVTDDDAAQLGLSSGGFISLSSMTGSGAPDVLDKNTASLTLKAENNGTITINDTIRGGAIDFMGFQNSQGSLTNDMLLESAEYAYDLKITGDQSGKIYLNNDIINANITLDNTNLYLGRENIFNQSQSLTLNSGSVYLNNNSIGTMHIPTLNLNGNVNLSVDVDLAGQKMDRITANSYNIKENANLNVQSLNLLNDATQDSTTILFADKEYAQNVQYTGSNPIAYSPIYKYDVSYNPEDGFFSFIRGGASSSNPSDNYNPAVLAPSVATQAGAYSTQLQTFNYAFQHSDNFMNIPYLERIALKYQNKYSLSPTADATDIGTFSPLFTKNESQAFWIKPYASFENIPLNNGPKVSNINYGTLIGHDSDLTPIKHGFERVLTSYIGYNGASQRFSGVDSYQNGALIGQTITLYKNNFFNATTLSVGASAGNSNNMYGSENYTMLLAGIANKTGYNLEFKNGKFILQPSFLLSYTFVNTFDYNNSAGLRIKSNPLHAIQLAPSLKFIANTNSGWQPYLAVSMIWNILDKSHVTANDVRLPSMSIDPYVAYGLGVQKRFNNEKYTAFAQTMIHNGGRNGISLTAGLRWHLGKDK